MTFDNLSDVLRRFSELKIWKRGDERAPHKPLLALLALGLYANEVPEMRFSEYEGKLNKLLLDFGPSRRTLYPEMPFVRLQNDDVWQVTADEAAHFIDSKGQPSKTQLRQSAASGRFSDDIQQIFERDPSAVGQVARLLLSKHFPETLHEDIMDAVGLTLDLTPGSTLDVRKALRRRRNPAFRDEVLKAYQHRCALCNLDMRINGRSVGLEAAHIKWVQYEGPDDVSNGMALCSLHHKLFDSGAFTLGDERRILVSDEVHGTEQFERTLLRHHGHQHNAPIHLEHHPFRQFIKWHRKEVFRGRARPF
jgi:putative restriction endonuclease